MDLSRSGSRLSPSHLAQDLHAGKACQGWLWIPLLSAVMTASNEAPRGESGIGHILPDLRLASACFLQLPWLIQPRVILWLGTTGAVDASDNSSPPF